MGELNECQDKRKKLAEDLGWQSLGGMQCPAAGMISQLLASYQDASCVLYDVLEVADCCGATGVAVTLDERRHGTQSLLQPNLGAFQGAALTVRLEGVMWSAEELSQLLAASAPFKLRGNVCRYDHGLLSVFSVTDLPLVVSGSSVYLVDPTGEVLAESLADGQRSGQPMGRAYAYVDSDLPTRFKDQFAPLQPLHADRPFHGTLLLQCVAPDPRHAAPRARFLADAHARGHTLHERERVLRQSEAAPC